MVICIQRKQNKTKQNDLVCIAQSPKKLEALVTRTCPPPSLAFCFRAGSVLAFRPRPASQTKGFFYGAQILLPRMV